MSRNDQPYLTKNYNTDQFTDPIYGYTIHDDGSEFYVQPQTCWIYDKTRILNGISTAIKGALDSYKIVLSWIGIVLTNDIGTPLTSDDGKFLTP